ncbi:hypothetical protein [Rhodoferax sp. U11-2br]|uniref:hypothetical protein n=1 Tax=Rhodoferax sp. U11-2br TaxID=2838878 RepID=UPI001BE7A59E|nr:hypothetical protein [Rhodoferax sp. U11-2br]MBT3068898.1 hypothetical protein [Rhodoferax sp. U11-2br]
MDTGLRIERLLYLAFFLVLLCCLEIYLVAAAAYFSASDTQSLDVVIEAVEKDRTELRRLFELQSRPIIPDTAREQRTAAMRQKLGLPPAERKNAAEETYKQRLENLLISLPRLWDLQAQLSEVFDLKNSPEEILAKLRSVRASKIPDKGTILGIETPRLLVLQYGSADFRLSAQPLATGLLIALYPLCVVWIGSFYITRQRELLAMRQLADYKETFPHVLNFLVVDFSGFHRKIGLQSSRKNVRFNLMLSAALTTSIRCLFLTMLVLPIIGGLAYSSFQLFDLLSPPMSIWIVTGAVFLFAASLSLSLVVQEAIVLRGKQFYE